MTQAPLLGLSGDQFGRVHCSNGDADIDAWLASSALAGAVHARLSNGGVAWFQRSSTGSLQEWGDSLVETVPSTAQATVDVHCGGQVCTRSSGHSHPMKFCSKATVCMDHALELCFAVCTILLCRLSMPISFDLSVATAAEEMWTAASVSMPEVCHVSEC